MSTSAQPRGVGASLLTREISTELSVTTFQLASGVFAGAAALIAARRLERADGSIPVTALALPIAVAGLSTVAGAFLLPTGEAA